MNSVPVWHSEAYRGVSVGSIKVTVMTMSPVRTFHVFNPNFGKYRDKRRTLVRTTGRIARRNDVENTGIDGDEKSGRMGTGTPTWISLLREENAWICMCCS